MRITDIRIKHFRSIEDIALTKLGNFSILVGRNNAGKSTVTTAIEYFFKIVTSKIVTEVFNQKDFHGKDTNVPIKIVSSLLLDEQCIGQLLSEMKDENPQILSAIDELGKMDYLNIYCSSLTSKDSNKAVYSYIEKITLSSNSIINDTEVSEKILFDISPKVAEELIDRSLRIASLSERIEELSKITSRIDHDEFRVIKERGRLPYSYTFKNREEIKDLILEATDYSEFRAKLSEDINTCSKKKLELTDKEIDTEFVIFAGKTRRIPRHLNNLLDSISKVNVLHELDRKQPINIKDAQKLLELKVTRGGPQRLVQLQNIVQELLGVQIDAFKGADELSTAEIDVDDFLVSMNGAGVRESLRLILDMEFASPDIIMIEEPEIHLHPALERKLLRYLVQLSTEKQIFITTHSTGFIDTSGANNVFLVKKERNTEITRLSDSEFVDIISELGINISSLLLAKVLIFVEGPSDEIIFRSYLETKYPNISYSDIGFVKMGGVGNYKYYCNSAALEILSKRNLKTIFVIDSDSLSNSEIESLCKSHPQNSNIHVLRSRTIENYFLDAKIIKGFLEMKLASAGLKGNVPNVDELRKSIEECINNLEAEAFRLSMAWKYLKPVYPISILSASEVPTDINNASEFIKKCLTAAGEHTHLTAEEFEKNISEEVELFKDAWSKEKERIVPGDKVIDMVAKRFGVRYKKTQLDGDFIAQAVDDRWPEELISLFAEIVKMAENESYAEF